MLLDVGSPHITSLTALGTIIQPIDGQTNMVLRLTETTEFLAGALRFTFLALRAERNHG